MDLKGSSYCHNFLTVTQSYNSKVTPIDTPHAEKISIAVLIYAYTIAFPAPLLKIVLRWGGGIFFKFKWILLYFHRKSRF